MRLDRFITLNLMQPLRRMRVTHHASPAGFLPILMYHSISDDPESGVRPYYRVCTGSRRFHEQMQWLKDNGYRGVGLSEGLAWLGSTILKQKTEIKNQKVENGKRKTEMSNGSNFQLPSLDAEIRPIAITFDDGFLDFYTEAFPILQEFGFTASMYLPTAFIGESRRRFKSRECLTWAQVKELHCTGIEFGSHTVHHPELVDLAWSEIQSEIGDSKAQIENQLGARVKAFAYPYAFPQTRRDFVRQLKDLLLACGYDTCVTTRIGRHLLEDDPLQIKRLPMSSMDDPALLQAKLEGGYDWLASGQATVKAFKRLKWRRNGTTN